MTNQCIDSQYMQLCSEKTLQANKEGFFLQFADAVAKEVGEKWIKHVFGKLKTDNERIRKIYEDNKIKDYIVEFLSNVQEIYRKKCAETSRKRRLEAEASLKTGDNVKSLALYSQSVLKASQSEELALALLGRSKILMAMKEYPNALSDIQLGLKEHFPSSMKAEAFWMMAVCYRASGEENKAKVSFNLAEKLMGTNHKLLGLLRDSMEQQYEGNTKRQKILPPITGDKHPKFQYASKKISVKNSQELGRYVVANAQIKSGETIVVEPAYAACLLPEKFGTHCHHCFERLVAPIGCPDCSSVAFCNPQCRDSAVTSYHKYECKFLDLLIGSGMSVLSHTALRIITQNSFEKSLEIYGSKNSLSSLCTNSSRRPCGDFLQRTLMAAFLLRCLQKSGYFKRDDAVMPTDEEYRIGEMLLHNLQVLQFNAHEVYETLYSAEHCLKGGRPSYIGVAVYPTVALFNHDCYPAVTRYFVGKHIVIKATRPLNPDDVIAENYGPIFTWRKLMERQRSLSARYWFNCRCSACVEDWPTLNGGLSSFVKRVRCPSRKCRYLFSLPTPSNLKCPSCKKDVSLVEHLEQLRWCEDQYELGLGFVQAREVSKAMEVICAALDTFHRVSAPPHREMHLAQELLRSCLVDSGNTYECLVKSSK